MRRSEHYRTSRANVVAFREALVELVAVMERRPEGVSGYFFRWVPRTGQSVQYDRLRTRVGEVAGPAAEVLHELGFSLQINEPPAFQQPPRSVNPFLTWSTALEPPNSIRIEDILGFCDRATGVLDGRIAQAERTERSLAGRVARFFSFPADVRDAMTGSRAAKNAAFTVAAIMLALVTGTAASLLALLISKVAGWA